MPRTKLGELFAPKRPPVDHAWGTVLVRLKQMDMDLKQLAAETGYSYDTIRHTMTDPPIRWPADQRDAILRALGLRATLVIEDSADGSWGPCR